ncbi:MAG: hypothetical protein FJZ58_06305 [Chlamydiae bacterium]|nr:hypothetical protein [Chlamydiota bacterium]
MKRTEHSVEFKAKVAMEAAKENHTLAELSSNHKVHCFLRRISSGRAKSAAFIFKRDTRATP